MVADCVTVTDCVTDTLPIVTVRPALRFDFTFMPRPPYGVVTFVVPVMGLRPYGPWPVPTPREQLDAAAIVYYPHVHVKQLGPNPTLTLLANSKSFSFSPLMCGRT